MKLFVAISMFLMTTPAWAARPNIIVIMCDDLGYSDVGFNGATDIVTPNLDSLAKQGTVFSSAYAAHPFCGPSRMGLMTGRYPHEFGAPFNLPESGKGNEEYYRQGVDVGETLISTVLQEAGYFTGAIGKWHMGTEPEYHPNSRGFDDYYGFLGGGHKYFPKQYKPIYERQLKAGVQSVWDYLTPLEHNGKEVDETEYITDALSREAVRFVDEASQKEQPFFLYLSYNAPHTPLEAKQEDMEVFPNIQDEKRKTYAAMVYAVDRGVGELIEALKSTKQLNDTLLVFLSDNGGQLHSGATNRPLKGSKGDTYEGGFRVPLFFHWPGRVATGKRYDHPVTTLDFYPTFANLANASIPEGKDLDGTDIWEDFQAGRSARPGKSILALRHRNGFSDVAVRRDQWKACRAYNQKWKLHNLDEDISEQHDLSNKQPGLMKSLVAEAEAWSKSHTPPRWFHALEARDEWVKTDMPNFEETFTID
ncbi:sulfatase-like hydrolase/transferase [Adhaeretor mobilis]|uniref:Arylsulfatase n=1 Tax=Adhaeretor mobilis TaxID=1930276 RepID=A0A517MUD6_9BACT|nr:sulfatase-like hydrolase/transferase [Adhaeretor mobilis]QDS98495.1 Arylsulfatase [Adhaeretor mobilis]